VILPVPQSKEPVCLPPTKRSLEHNMLKDNRMPTNQCTFFLYVPIPPANLSQGTVVTKRRPNSDGIINLSTIPQPPPRYTPKWLQDAPTPVAGRSGFVRHNRRIRGQILALVGSTHTERIRWTCHPAPPSCGQSTVTYSYNNLLKDFEYGF